METSLPKEEIKLFKQLKGLKVIFDVGARTDTEYLEIYPNAEFHLFEPNPKFFKDLETKVGDRAYLNNFGLGDKNTEMGYRENLQSFIDSKPINDPYAEKDMVLPLKTLAKYIEDRNIKRIDFLKIDTEGYDLKVLLGATNWYHIIKFIQYEHWGEHDNKMITGLLQDDFDLEYIGYRNMLCMNKKLVSSKERQRIKRYICDNKLADLD